MNRRNAYQDYRAPAFYMITMTTHERRPLFGHCENNRSLLNEVGWLAYNLWHAMPQAYPAVATSTLVIMPDHLHGIVRVTAHMPQSVGVPLRAFKSQVTSALRKKVADPVLTVWQPGYHDLCVWRRGALKAYTHYLCDNPRRYCLKKANPDLFRRINNLHHARLPQNETWTGFGNLFLLDKPEIEVLQVSRGVSKEELAAKRRHVLKQVAEGAVIVSPFISPGEKAISRAALDAGGAVILIKPDGFGPFFKPHGHYFDLCLQGRLLILACRPPEEGPVKLTRQQCLAMNGWAAAIAPPPANLGPCAPCEHGGRTE